MSCLHQLSAICLELYVELVANTWTFLRCTQLASLLHFTYILLTQQSQWLRVCFLFSWDMVVDQQFSSLEVPKCFNSVFMLCFCSTPVLPLLIRFQDHYFFSVIIVFLFLFLLSNKPIELNNWSQIVRYEWENIQKKNLLQFLTAMSGFVLLWKNISALKRTKQGGGSSTATILFL